MLNLKPPRHTPTLRGADGRFRNLPPASREWRSWEVFHGDNDIGYAEPDETGDRLVIIEHHVGDNETGILYSVKARQIWYDLGSDYK